MGVIRAFDGCEIPEVMSAGPVDFFQMLDIQKARSGRGYYKFKKVVAGSLSFNGQHTGAMALTGADAVQEGLRGRAVGRKWLRICPGGLPSVDCALWAMSFTTGDAGIVLKSNGTFCCAIVNSAAINEGAASTMVLAAMGAADNNYDQWHKLSWQVDVFNNGTSDEIAVSFTVTKPTGESETVTHSRIFSAGTTINMQLIRLMGSVALNYGTSGTCDLDLDDYVVINASNADRDLAVLPAEDRVALFLPTGQGSEDQWTNDWWWAAKVSVDSASNDKQIVTGIGNRTTFSHDTATSRGITSIGGVMLTMIATATGTVAAKFRLDGTTVVGQGSTQISLPTSEYSYFGEIASRSLASFDAMEFGAESNHATTNNLYGVHLQVLYSGSAHGPAERSTGGYRHKLVEWTGTGAADHRQQVTGVGFLPHFIMVFPIATSGVFFWKSGDMPGNLGYSNAGARLVTHVLSMDSDGFTVTTTLNLAGVHYVALVVRDDGDGAQGRNFVHGSCTRMDAAGGNQATVFGYGTNLQVDSLQMINAIASSNHYWKTADMGTLSPMLSAAGAPSSTGILSLDANGFTLGTDADLIATQDPLFFIGWKLTSQMAPFIQKGEIAPSAPDVVVTLTDGLQPYLVWARGNNTVAASKRMNEAEFTASQAWNGTSSVTLAIIVLDQAGGTFTIAGGTSVGKHLDDSPAVECWWMAFHLEAAIPPTTEITIPETEGPVGLTWVELTDSGSNLNVWSTVALPDPPTYYGGYKEARVTTFGTIRRALSDDLGQYEGIDFSFTLDDSDRRLRTMLDDVTTRYFPNRAVVVRTITDELRRVQQIPRTILRGLVRLYRPAKNLLFDFTVQDSLAALFSPQGDNRPLPKRRITIGNFPNCPQAAASGAGASVKTFTTPHASIPIPPCSGYVQLSDQAAIVCVGGTVSNGTYGLCDARGWIMYDGSGTLIGEGWGGHNPPVPGDVIFASPDVATAMEAAAGGGTTDMVSLSLPVPIIYGSITDKKISGGVDAGEGQCPGLYVGAYTLSDTRTYHKWVIAGHACKAIDGIYGCNGDQGVGTSPASQIGNLAVIAGVGGDWVVPGYGAWTTLKGAALYEDLNGERFTVVYGLVGNLAADIGAGFFPPLNDASVPLAFSVQGIETTGDGTGTLITELLPQYLHALQNWVLGDYRTGPWLSSPGFSDEPTLLMIDEASFATANLVSKRRITGGYRGDFIIGSSVPGRTVLDNLSGGDRVSVRELVARFNISADVNSGFNRKGQFMVSMIDDADFNVASVMTLNDQSHVHRDSFDVFDDQGHHWNVAPFRHTRDYFLREADGWRSVQTGTSELKDDFSISHYGPVGTQLRLEAPTLLLHMVRGVNRSSDSADYTQGSATAADVVGRFLMRHKDPPRLATFQLGMIGHNTDLGDVVRLTHYAGAGASGWSGRPLRVIRHEASPGEYSVDLMLFDLQTLFATGFILGDETALPALWPSASPAQRFYAYLGDETTGLFSTGQPMKRVR